MHTFSDDFAGGALDGSRWEIVEGPERITVDNRLEIGVAPNTLEAAYIRSVEAFDFTGSYGFVEVSEVARGSNTLETTLLIGTKDLGQYVAIASYSGRLSAWEQWDGSNFFRIGSEITLNMTNHRFRRMRESGGTVYFETSPDGASWTTRWQVQHQFDDPTRLHLFIVVSSWDTPPQDPTPAYFEGFNTTIPASPRGLTATVASPGTIEIAWEDRSVNEAGFIIERRTASGGGFAEIAVIDANATSYTDIGLPPSTTFEYRVRAYNASGVSAPSAAASATTLDPPSTTPPIADLSDAFIGSGIDGSRWTVYGPAGWVAQDGRLTITPAPGASGFAGVRSVLPHTVTGSSVYTEISQVAGGSAAVETYLRVTSEAGDDYVQIGVSDGQLIARYRWNGGTVSTAGSPVPYSPAEHRFLRLREDGGTIYFETSATGAAWSARWSTANQFSTPSLLYAEIGIGAQGGTGASPTPAYFEGINTLIPATPRNLAVVAVGETRIDLSWDDVAVNESGYSIERRSGDDFTQIATVGPNVTTFQDLTVHPARSYEYRVRAIGEQGASGYTNVAQATTPGTPGAQYSWSAADYADGTPLTSAGWTVRLNDAGWAVRTVDGVKVARLESIKGVGTSEHITLDAVDEDPYRYDVEILLGGVRLDRVGGSDYLILDVVGRYRQNGSSREYYGVGHVYDAAANLQGNVQYIWAMNGNADLLAPPEISDWTPTTRGFMLIRITGNVIRGKVWTGSVEDEPAAWTFESTNNVISGLGSVGVHFIGRPSDRPTFEYVTVGTGGKPAPRHPF